ncbi:MAG: hypothetical protein R3212_01575, partial [Xanthomonadales bacterium]|nr:hypothetical protein [Xanthomonadales bacterium]
MKHLCLSLIVLLVAANTLADGHEHGANRKFTADRVFDIEYANDPQISPDGSTIVYARTSMDRVRDRMVGEIWTIDTATGTQRPLITGQGSISSPRWSPSGDRLLYLGSAEGKLQLRIMFLDSGRSFSLAFLEEAPGAPQWSPDGKLIAFSMFKPGEPPSFAKPPTAPEGAQWNEPVRIWDDVQYRFDGAGYLREGSTQ